MCRTMRCFARYGQDRSCLSCPSLLCSRVCQWYLFEEALSAEQALHGFIQEQDSKIQVLKTCVCACSVYSSHRLLIDSSLQHILIFYKSHILPRQFSELSLCDHLLKQLITSDSKYKTPMDQYFANTINPSIDFMCAAQVPKKHWLHFLEVLSNTVPEIINHFVLHGTGLGNCNCVSRECNYIVHTSHLLT